LDKEKQIAVNPLVELGFDYEIAPEDVIVSQRDSIESVTISEYYSQMILKDV